MTRWVDGPVSVDRLIFALRMSGPSPALYVSFENRNTLWKSPDSSGETSARSKRSSRAGSVLRSGKSGVLAACAGVLATTEMTTGAAITATRNAPAKRRMCPGGVGIESLLDKFVRPGAGGISRGEIVPHRVGARRAKSARKLRENRGKQHWISSATRPVGRTAYGRAGVDRVAALS